jgi:hypothetical protein
MIHHYRYAHVDESIDTNCTTFMSQPQLHRTVSDNTVI